MTTNLLPAILLAGPPHSGKSALAYLLSRRLRAESIPHILLRAVPDGEGDWSHESADEVRMRQRRKGVYTPTLIEELQRAIHSRSLPMLVDIGGRPRDVQFRLFDACTHVIHLWREPDDRSAWKEWLEERSLIPVACLRSQLEPPDNLEPTSGPLAGVITGLDRVNPHPGSVFERLLERVKGTFTYPQAVLEAEHLSRAPAGVPLMTLTQLAQDLDITVAGQDPWWKPEHLPPLRELLPAGEPLALYGRGPAWLYAGLAAHVAPAPFYLFDARFYGWMTPPEVHLSPKHRNMSFTLTTQAAGNQVRLVFERKPEHYILRPAPVYVPTLPAEQGVILDGPMPLWLWTALARGLSHHPLLAAYEPRSQRAIVFWEAEANPAEGAESL